MAAWCQAPCKVCGVMTGVRVESREELKHARCEKHQIPLPKIMKCNVCKTNYKPSRTNFFSNVCLICEPEMAKKTYGSESYGFHLKSIATNKI